MRVVLDTNIFLQDIPAQRPAFTTLLAGLDIAGHRLVMTQIVFDELINKYKEDVEQLLRSARKLGIGPQGPIQDIAIGDVDASTGLFSEFLRRRFPYGKLVPYPSTPHTLLVGRALERKKPFRNSDTGGYRDSLLWHTIVELAREDPGSPIAFVTSNLKDFGSSKTPAELHPDLCEDISSHDHPTSAVTLFGRLEDFVEAHVTPVLVSLDGIRAELAASTFSALNLVEFVQEGLQPLVAYKEFQPDEIGFPPTFETSHLSMVNDIEGVTDVDVRQLPSGELLISFRVTANCEFDVFIYKSDYYSMSETHQPYVWNSDWNEWYVAASASTDVEMLVDLIFDRAAGAVKSASIADIHPVEEY